MTEDLFIKYIQCGGGESLGDPKQSEQVVVDRYGVVGCYRDFAKCSIYWSTETRACIVKDKILATWRSRGAQNSDLGYPVEDQKENHSGILYSKFQRGIIYYDEGRDLCRISIQGKHSTIFWRRFTITAVMLILFLFAAVYFNLDDCAIKLGIAMGERDCNIWNAGILPTILLLLAPVAGLIIRLAWPKSDSNFDHNHPY